MFTFFSRALLNGQEEEPGKLVRPESGKTAFPTVDLLNAGNSAGGISLAAPAANISGKEKTKK